MCSHSVTVKMSCCFTQCGGCGVFSQCKFVKMSCCFTQCGGCGVFSQCKFVKMSCCSLSAEVVVCSHSVSL